MSSVLPFPAGGRAGATAESSDMLVCECGSAWFTLIQREPGDQDGAPGVVVLNLEGSVTGYMGLPHCVECGQQKVP